VHNDNSSASDSDHAQRVLVSRAHSDNGDNAIGGDNALRSTDERRFTAIEPAMVR